MKTNRILLVDAYNVIHRIPALRRALGKNLLAARTALVRRCADWMAGRGDFLKCTLVFDGDSSVMEPGAGGAPGVNVVFTRSGETADQRMMAWLQAHQPGMVYQVVSDDREVTDCARRERADVWTVRQFEAMLYRAAGPGLSADDEKPELGDRDARAITESLRRIWGDGNGQ
ncbi:MAG: hypothetical protein A2498_07905 [Lentisphaerae bacterium RIFOXYC12_FULL_60_16]|nr:MAG: hypothetical protein A2498_07905 [Lentisphaerae bacterium RIFOXYC12_FULL_60_16]OGV72123.1 MAG: hypothetical protein A2269_05895 [Lentisphaerae bacterium RIFOXYA12_FULL_60_10]